MKLSALKKEILLILWSETMGGKRLVDFGVNFIITKINEKRPSYFKRLRVNGTDAVCVQRSLKRLVKDGLLYVAESRYYLNSRGKRKAQEIETEIRNYMYRWWKFVKVPV